MSLRISTEPTEEPVTLAEAKLHLRIDEIGSSSDGHPDDSLVSVMTTAARDWAEHFLRRSLVTKTYELTLDEFADEIELPMPPVQSVVSVQYVDEAGDTQTLSSALYSLDKRTEPGYLLPAAGSFWPKTADQVNAVTIRYVAGYSGPAEDPQAYPLPRSLRAGVLLLLHDLYENRGNAADKPMPEVPLAAERVMQFYRLGGGV